MSSDIRAGRLSREELAANFADIHPPLNSMQAAIEASRCLFCHDAPCIEACPTGIDIPGFIRKIMTGNLKGAAVTILDANIMGGTCANVCPVEELCEEVCVRNTAEEKPVTIGALQRHATDDLFAKGLQPFKRAPETGRTVAVVGAGPAGLSCAHRLARHGHHVVVYEAHEKGGGLNEYGIAHYKMVNDRAAKEVKFILGIGGIELRTSQALGTDFTLDELRANYDAVFLGLGLDAVNALGLPEEDIPGVYDAVDFIERIRQEDHATLPVGRRVVVIGGGNTAIDIAVQMKKLGAEESTIVYRRDAGRMSATWHEQEVAKNAGVLIRTLAQPSALIHDQEGLTGVAFERTEIGPDGALRATGQTYTLACDMLFKAIGQRFDPAPFLPAKAQIDIDRGRIVVDQDRRTSLPDVYAGGDCIPGLDLTVAAVEDGKIAAEAIHRSFQQADNG